MTPAEAAAAAISARFDAARHTEVRDNSGGDSRRRGDDAPPIRAPEAALADSGCGCEPPPPPPPRELHRAAIDRRRCRRRRRHPSAVYRNRNSFNAIILGRLKVDMILQ